MFKFGIKSWSFVTQNWGLLQKVKSIKKNLDLLLMNSLRQIAAKASKKPPTLFSYFRTCVACLPSYLFTLIPPLLWRCNYENKQRSFTENSRRTVTRFQLSVAQPVKVHDAIG